MIKECPGCKKTKSVNDFYTDRARKDGLYYYCKVCSNTKTKEYLKRTYQQRKPKITLNRKRWEDKIKKGDPDYFKQQRAIYNLKIRKKVIAGYGGKCACCGEETFEFLAIDHVNNDGTDERKWRNCQQTMYRVLKENFPPWYQILCHNCNSSKGFHGYCPHTFSKDVV